MSASDLGKQPPGPKACLNLKRKDNLAYCTSCDELTRSVRVDVGITAFGVLGVPPGLCSASVYVWVRDVCFSQLRSHCVHCFVLSPSGPASHHKRALDTGVLRTGVARGPRI